MRKISHVKRINCVMITLNKLLSTKIKKKNFFSILNEVKEFYKRKLEIKKKKSKMLLLLTRINSLLHCCCNVKT